MFDQEGETINYNYFIGGRGIKFGQVGKPTFIVTKIIDKTTGNPVFLQLSEISLMFKNIKTESNVFCYSNGIYFFMYSPKKPGSYHFSIKMKKDETSVYVVQWHETTIYHPNPEKCLITGLFPVLKQGKKTSFNILLSDGSNPKIQILITSDGVESNIKLNNPRKYKVNQKTILIEGPGLLSGVIGTPGSIYIKIDSNLPLQNPGIILFSKGPSNIDLLYIRASKRNNGIYVITYCPKQAGAYELSLSIFGKIIKLKTVN